MKQRQKEKGTQFRSHMTILSLSLSLSHTHTQTQTHALSKYKLHVFSLSFSFIPFVLGVKKFSFPPPLFSVPVSRCKVVLSMQTQRRAINNSLPLSLSLFHVLGWVMQWKRIPFLSNATKFTARSREVKNSFFFFAVNGQFASGFFPQLTHVYYPLSSGSP